MCPSSRPFPQPEGPSGFRHAFDLLDADHDGKIGHADLKSIHSSSTDDDIGCMIAAADLDRDGFVEFNEFERVIGNEDRRPTTDWWMVEVFHAMDRDGDGRVGFEGLKTYLNAAGMAVEDDAVRAMVRVGAGPGDGGGVSLEGVVKILTVDLPCGPDVAASIDLESSWKSWIQRVPTTISRSLHV